MSESKKAPGRLRAEDRQGDFVRKEGEELQRQAEKINLSTRHEPSPRRSQWLKIIFLMAVLGTLATFLMLPPPDENAPIKEAEPSSTPAASNFIERSTAKEIKIMTEKVVRGFMESESAEEAGRYLLNGSSRTERLRRYLERPGESLPRGFGKIMKVMPMAYGGLPMRTVIASEADGRNAWILILAPTRDRLVIDWEATVAYGDLSWREFLSRRPTTPTLMRVYLLQTRHQESLPDHTKNDFYRIEARREKVWVPSFVPSDSEVARQLREIVPPKSSQPVTIRLQWNAQREVAEILELVHNHWVDLTEYDSIPHSTPAHENLKRN